GMLSDHKALLFDKNKQLLLLPVSVYEINDKDEKEYENDPGTYGNFQYQGAYVFRVTNEGFSFRDRITHLNQTSLDALQNHSWYRRNDERFIHRTLYIENVLYTLSNTMIQAHELDELSLVNQIVLE
ncbi:MAG: beta-propeller domain-containing protein, partial [Candidatus Thermoplasmatota archaeon]|nr:beta-propeller domain-containing protein [Candidatus Thermoplasmatota archaeon]